MLSRQLMPSDHVYPTRFDPGNSVSEGYLLLRICSIAFTNKITMNISFFGRELGAIEDCQVGKCRNARSIVAHLGSYFLHCHVWQRSVQL